VRTMRRCWLSRLEESVEFATNPDPRCPCLLLLDTSGSMEGEPVAHLNSGLELFQTDLQQDELARRRCEVALVTFGGTVSIMQDFVTADQFRAPHLTASGQTPMGAAMLQGLRMIRERKEKYRQAGIDYYRPWMFLITDGEPTDAWQEATRQVHAEAASNGLIFFAVGVPPSVNMQTLGQIAAPGRQAVMLKSIDSFREMFKWLSNSQRRVSASKPGEQVALTPVGWSTI
jgi:uncharacterized protein YegL